MLSVVKAGLPSAPRLPPHQSQKALPPFTQSGLSMAEGLVKFMTAFDSIILPGSSPTIIMRHEERMLPFPFTAMPELSNRGESLDNIVWPDHPPEGLVRYIEL